MFDPWFHSLQFLVPDRQRTCYPLAQISSSTSADANEVSTSKGEN